MSILSEINDIVLYFVAIGLGIAGVFTKDIYIIGFAIIYALLYIGECMKKVKKK